MGCDIHVIYERRDESGAYVSVTPARLSSDSGEPRGYAEDLPFDWRWYGLFGFLAGVYNRHEIPQMVWWERGFPKDSSVGAKFDWNYFYFGYTHITIAELEAFDYEQTFIDMRPFNSRTHTTYRDFLHEAFFESIQLCKDAGVERILLRFDN